MQASVRHRSVVPRMNRFAEGFAPPSRRSAPDIGSFHSTDVRSTGQFCNDGVARQACTVVKNSMSFVEDHCHDSDHPSVATVDGTNRISSQDDSRATPEVTSLAAAYEVYATLKSACESRMQGRSDVIDLLSLLADGDVLLDQYPGSGKTTLAKALGDCIDRRADQSGPIAS